MKKINIISFSFDKRTKIVMGISIIIAIVIIIYSFYNICIENGLKKVTITTIDDFININGYEANYTICVNSNKNSNTYNVEEKADLINNTYNYLIDGNFKININNKEIKISKENISYEYLTTLQEENSANNFISFSTVINIIKKINSNELDGNIKRVEVNENIVYKIHTDEEYVKKTQDIEIIMSKNESNIIEIKMYNNEEKEQYSIVFNEFIVKK